MIIVIYMLYKIKRYTSTFVCACDRGRGKVGWGRVVWLRVGVSPVLIILMLCSMQIINLDYVYFLPPFYPSVCLQSIHRVITSKVPIKK